MLRFARIAALLLCFASPLAASAQTPEEKETARTLMDAGHHKLDEGDLNGALQAFQSADEIMKVPTTGLARGKVLGELGRLTEAVDVLRRVARHPAEPGEPQAFTEARLEAAKLDKMIADRIPSVVITVNGPPSSEVTLEVDGRPIDDAAVGMPLRVDPGRHTIRVSAPRHFPQERVVTLEERKTAALEVTLELDPNAPVPDPSGPDPEPAPLAPADGGVPVVSIAAFAVAGAALVAGAITGGISLSKVGDLEAACPTKTNCPTELQSEHDTMLALANASNATFAIAGAAALVGIVTLFVVDTGAEETAIRAVVGPTGAGLTGRF